MIARKVWPFQMINASPANLATLLRMSCITDAVLQGVCRG
jgi:hypothetical protein